VGPNPIAREALHRPAPQVSLRRDARSISRTSLPGNPLAPSAARRFARAALKDWASLGLLATCTFCREGTACSPGRHSADLLADDAVLVVDELVTNAVVHAGTTVELLCRLEAPSHESAGAGQEDEPAALILEVSDHHPARTVRDGPDDQAPSGPPEYGRGLQLVAALAERWGITYRSRLKTVWARLPLEGRATGQGGGTAGPAPRHGARTAEILAPAPRRPVREAPEWTCLDGLSFLAEASELLTGQLDEDLVAALTGQLLVPRLADWCAVWLDGESTQAGAAPRPTRVWHADESRIASLRAALRKEPPSLPDPARGTPVPVPWPVVERPEADRAAEGVVADNGADSGASDSGASDSGASDSGATDTGGTRDRVTGDGLTDGGAALACRLVANDRAYGTLMLGRPGESAVPDEVASLIEDFARRVALGIEAARRYTRQVTISRVLQRGLLPSQVARIPGVASALVYEPGDEGLAGGDFYDVFPCPPGDRWCFMLGDVQGSGPEAAVVTGLARPWLRLLAREGYRVGAVLDRFNRLLLDNATEAAESASLVAAATAAPPGAAPGLPERSGGSESSQTRFLSLLYGELMPLPDGSGVRCTLASAGHPLPLLMRPDGTVRPAAEPQVLLGIMEGIAYESSTFDLTPGDTLLCVTDGVTERRSGRRMLDDGDGLARALEACLGMTAQGVADRIRRAVHEFAAAPPGDDLALLVLQAE
jgi:serine phosphatase RsbU (regulator of sigma subunit)